MAGNRLSRITWLAGLMEGEGSFMLRGKGHNPYLSLTMVDRDVVIAAAEILGAHKVIQRRKLTATGKAVFQFGVYGSRATQWMMTLFTLMGERRRGQITKCLQAWRSKKTDLFRYQNRPSYWRSADVVWVKETT